MNKVVEKAFRHAETTTRWVMKKKGERGVGKIPRCEVNGVLRTLKIQRGKGEKKN